jgi:hypothetical protein
MSLLISSRTAQSPLVAEFTFNFDDTMVPAAGGAAVDFGATNTSATTVVAIPLPPNSTVIGGSVDRNEAFDAATFNVTVGDATTADRYLGTTDVKAVGTTALVPTGYLNVAGENIELTFTAADVCTTGNATVRVEYVVQGRACEVQIA